MSKIIKKQVKIKNQTPIPFPEFEVGKRYLVRSLYNYCGKSIYEIEVIQKLSKCMKLKVFNSKSEWFEYSELNSNHMQLIEEIPPTSINSESDQLPF